MFVRKAQSLILCAFRLKRNDKLKVRSKTAPQLNENARFHSEYIMKISKLVLVPAVLLAVLSSAAAATQVGNPVKGTTPRALVADLYRQHKKKRGPFFQTRSRALLDKYFARELADRIWRDARSAGDEVGAIDGDPLFNAQDMEIRNFSIQEAVGGPRMVVVPVTFENLGQKHEIKFRLFSGGGRWRIGNIEYDDGSSLLEILKSDQNRKKTNSI